MEQKQTEVSKQLLQVIQNPKTPQTQPKPPSLLKNISSRKQILIGLIILLVIVGIGLFIFYRMNSSSIIQQPSVKRPSTEPILQLQGKQIDKNEGDIAFLQNGNIWLVSKNLKNKMAYELSEITEPIVDFKFSPSGQQLFWLTDNGELWKTDDVGEVKSLVTKKRDMTDATQETFGVGEPFPYIKGKVTKFYLSPDGIYIAYETLEKYTGCCGSTSDIPVTQLRIMKNDGTNKVSVLKPSSVKRELVFFDGWFPDSKKVLFHFAAPDEATQGSPFFEVGLDGSNPKQYKTIDFTELGDTITVAGASPVFSPDAEKMVYIEGGVVGEGKIWLAKTDGTEKKLLVDDESLNLTNTTWSEDGSLLLINSTNKVIIFNPEGKIIFQRDVQQPEEFESIVSPDNKYLVGLNRTGDNRTDKLFILNINTGEKKEFTVVNSDGQPVSLYVYPQFFSEGGKFYYLAGSEQLKYSGKDTIQTSFQLWVIDLSNSKNYKIADNVLEVRRLSSFTSKVNY